MGLSAPGDETVVAVGVDIDEEGREESRQEAAFRELVEGVDAHVAVEAWDSNRFRTMGRLQAAQRNQGQVLLMVDTQAQEEGFMGGFARVAVKQMPNHWMLESSRKFSSVYPSSAERPWQDIGVLRYLNAVGYPYVCRLLGVFRDGCSTYVATGLASLGDLFDWCSSPRMPPPGPARLRHAHPVVVQALGAVRWLHDLGVMHRDISAENILLHEDGAGSLLVRLCDFGMATLKRWCCREPRGKPTYQAPEMHTSTVYDGFLTDSFALGVTIFSLVARDYPWEHTAPGRCRCFDYVSCYGLRAYAERRQLGAGAESEGRKHLIDILGEPCLELLEGLTQPRASERMTLGEADWVQEADARTSVWNCAWVEGHENLVDTSLFYSGGAKKRAQEVQEVQKQLPQLANQNAELDDIHSPEEGKRGGVIVSVVENC